LKDSKIFVDLNET